MSKFGIRDLVLFILLLVSLGGCIHFYHKCSVLQNKIESKDEKIQSLIVESNNHKMAEDEFYELFLNCVYPDGVPNYEENNN